jgi:integrase
MPTEILTLRKTSSGYYRSDWECVCGSRHGKSFGPDRRKAENAFSRFHAAWQKDDDLRCPDRAGAILTIQAAWDRFKQHADAYYVHPDGRPTGESRNIEDAFRYVLDLFAGIPAADFGPLMMKRARQRMIDDDLCLNLINARVNKIRHVFKWLASEELVPESTWVALQTVQSLAAGRQMARETDPVEAVADRWVWAVVAVAPETIAAMIQVQYWTAARPGEVCIMRACDIQTADINGRPLRVWRYMPAQDKCAWRRRITRKGRRKTILLGRRAQDAIRGLMANRPTDAYLFGPLDAQRQRWAACGTHRHQENRPPATTRKLLDHYTTGAYGYAIRYICNRLEIPVWSPNQLRHAALTRLGNHFSEDLARIVAGHAKLDTTEIYMERELSKAAAVMEHAG